MNLFLNLLAGHLVGDFALQTGRIAMMKRLGIKGLLLHVSLVAAATAVFISQDFTYWPVVPILAAVHFCIDAVRTFPLRHMRRGQLLYFIVDQAVHMGSLALIAMWWQPGAYHSLHDLLQPRTLEDQAAFIISALVILIFMVPVIEAIIQGYHYNALHTRPVPQVTLRMRLLGAIERVIGFTLMQTPWAYLMPILFVPHFVYRVLYNSHLPFHQRMVRPALSLLFTALVGWVVSQY